MKNLFLSIVVLSLALLTACTSSQQQMISTTSTTASGASFTPVYVSDSSLGRILVDSNGMTLYTFSKDSPGVSNCYGACAAKWPPVTVPPSTILAGTSEMIGTVNMISRTDGTYQVTYNNMPLYTYSNDTNPGDVNGNGFLNLWSVTYP